MIVYLDQKEDLSYDFVMLWLLVVHTLEMSLEESPRFQSAPVTQSFYVDHKLALEFL